MFSRQLKIVVGAVAFVAMYAACAGSAAQDNSATDYGTKSRPAQRAAGARGKQILHRIATIHWQRVPLREALGRLHGVFDESVFLDRRIDPGMRVSLDIEASSAEEVVAAIAAQHHLGVGRLGPLVYLGPPGTAERLASVAAARSREVNRLPADWRASLAQKKPVAWPRLSEPRRLVVSLIRATRLAYGERRKDPLTICGPPVSCPI